MQNGIIENILTALMAEGTVILMPPVRSGSDPDIGKAILAGIEASLSITAFLTFSHRMSWSGTCYYNADWYSSYHKSRKTSGFPGLPPYCCPAFSAYCALLHSCPRQAVWYRNPWRFPHNPSHSILIPILYHSDRNKS